MGSNAAIFNSPMTNIFGGSITATKTSRTLDCLGCETLSLFYKFGTTTTGTSGTVTISITESSDDSSYAAITGATTAALTLDTGGQNAKQHAIIVNMKGRKRYVRAVYTVSGTVNPVATGEASLAGGFMIATNPAVSVASTAFDSLTQVVTA